MSFYKKSPTIIVSEPWDFKVPDGKNIIRGIILLVVNSSLLIFKSDHILNFDGVTGDTLILSPRFKNGNFENIINKEIAVNGGLFLGDYTEELDKSKLKENCKFVIIGAVNGEI